MNIYFFVYLSHIYYTTKKFLFQDLTRQKSQNFIKKVFKNLLTSGSDLWYNKRGSIFFFFFFDTPGGAAAPAPFVTHPGALRRKANICLVFWSISPPTIIITYFLEKVKSFFILIFMV